MKTFNINIQKKIQVIFKCHNENIYVSIEFITS
jgi:hypothetical protein